MSLSLPGYIFHQVVSGLVKDYQRPLRSRGGVCTLGVGDGKLYVLRLRSRDWQSGICRLLVLIDQST